MNLHAIAALELALRLYRAPQQAQALRNDLLPEAGIDRVIRCASGEEAALVEASAQLNTSREVLREAAAFYLTQTLFARDADAWRVLGVRPGASQDVLRAHFRLLVHWLATSRNRDPLYALYGDRVQRAWTELRRSPEEIAARAQRRPPPAILPPRRQRFRLGAEHYSAEVLRLLRALPTWAVGSVAGALLLALLATYWLTRADVSPASFAADNAASPTVPLAAATVKPAHSGTRVPQPPVVRQVSLMPPRHAPGPARIVAAASVPAARLAPPVAAGSSAAVAYNPAAAASATEALARAAATAAAAAQGRTSPGPQASTSSAVAVPARAAQTPASAASQVAARGATVSGTAATPPTPVTSAVETPVIAVAAPVAPGATVRALLQRFVSTYESADLRGFMALFAPDARENRGGVAAIREDYGQLFAGSDLRRLQLYDVRIVPAAHAMIDVRVRYHAGVLMHGASSMAEYSGGMHLVLRSDPQGLRIIQLLRGDEAEIKPSGVP